MKIINASTNTFPVLSVGAYETNLDPRYFFEREEEEFKNTPKARELLERWWNEFDNQAYMKDLGLEAAKTIENSFENGELSALKSYGVLDMKGGKIVSPAYYNFSTDEMDIDITLADDAIDKIKRCLREEVDHDRFTRWLKENFTSYDGFMSYVPNTKLGFLEGLETDSNRVVPLALYFILRDVYEFDETDLQEEFFEDLTGNGRLEWLNYCTDKTATQISNYLIRYGAYR